MWPLDLLLDWYGVAAIGICAAAFFVPRVFMTPLLVAGMALGAFWAGDHYGASADRYAACKSETARRNAQVAAVNSRAEAERALAQAQRAAADRAFADACKNLQQCPLEARTAACLALIK